MIRGFLEENPDCADRALRHSVARMQNEGFCEDEIRAYLEDLHDCAHLHDVDIDSVLE
jgi:hypothetical protein